MPCCIAVYMFLVSCDALYVDVWVVRVGCASLWYLQSGTSPAQGPSSVTVAMTLTFYILVLLSSLPAADYIVYQYVQLMTRVSAATAQENLITLTITNSLF